MAISKEEKGASRQERKAKKRKAEDAIPDVPEDNVEVPEPQAGVVKKRKHSHEDGEEKDAKKAKGHSEQLDETVGEDTQGDVQSGERKSKKERKAERKAKEAAEKAALDAKASSSSHPDSTKAESQTSNKDLTIPSASTTITPATDKPKPKNNRNRAKKREAAAAALASGEAKPPRFIVFIGNLPWTATKESITKHFAAVKPISVRHRTEKDNPKKSTGIAFLEFEGYDHMKTCLKLYHHSEFNDGISGARQINVELSAGGGGNSKGRKTKIAEKNTKLNEERSNRAKEAAKAKLGKQKEGAIDASAIHPSRRQHVPDVA